MDVFANKFTFEVGIKLVATSMLKKKISLLSFWDGLDRCLLVWHLDMASWMTIEIVIGALSRKSHIYDKEHTCTYRSQKANLLGLLCLKIMDNFTNLLSDSSESSSMLLCSHFEWD